MATIVYWDSDGVERLYELGTESILIGRASECQIRSEDTRVSRRHARLSSDGRDCWIEDLDSANGVYVGPHKVNQAQIPAGEIVVVGSFLLQLQSADGYPAMPSPGAHAQLSVWLKMERESRSSLTDERNALAQRVAELHGETRARTHLSETTEMLSQQVEEVRIELEQAKQRDIARLRVEYDQALKRDIAHEVERVRAELEQA
ncbi:MAG: FHA domain-containing protein, partial [Myxococcota bacterium]